MSRPTFSTTSCSNFGHPEITLTFSQPPPVPGLEAGLLSYFEAEVSRGTRFLPGETVQAGWLLLRMCKRADGTLGVQELDSKAPDGWVEAVDRSLVQSWYQEQVGEEPQPRGPRLSLPFRPRAHLREAARGRARVPSVTVCTPRCRGFRVVCRLLR